jgi:hypothetical protein
VALVEAIATAMAATASTIHVGIRVTEHECRRAGGTRKLEYFSDSYRREFIWAVHRIHENFYEELFRSFPRSSIRTVYI